MFGKNRNKKVGLCVMVVTACLVIATLWAVLATPETALAEPGKDKGGGDAGVAPVCIEFAGEGGVQSDNGPYYNDKRLKVEAIMTQDGHVNLQLNTDRCDRTLDVYTNLSSSTPLAGWRFLVGGHNENFDMRAMEIGEVRTDVNLMINTKAPPVTEENWWLIFDPSYERWHINYSASTHVTVTCTAVDKTTGRPYEWVVENKDGMGELSKAVRVIQTKVKNKSEFTYGGVVTVPLFTATVTLN